MVQLQRTPPAQQEPADTLEGCRRQRCCCACANRWLGFETQVLQGRAVSGLGCSQRGGECLNAGICQAPWVLLQEWKLVTVRHAGPKEELPTGCAKH